MRRLIGRIWAIIRILVASTFAVAILAGVPTRAAAQFSDKVTTTADVDSGFDGLYVKYSPTLLPGDANGDDAVDINDLTIVLANYNQSGNWGFGNFNGDNKVDINDLTIVLAHYNQSLGASAVPEPSCLALVSVGAIGWLACAWRRKRAL
jgi:hypothetical protein